MIRYVYDGSFDGFLTAAERALADPKGVTLSEVSLADRSRAAGELFSTDVTVVSDPPRARAFRKRYAGIAGADELETLLLVHASEDPAAPGLLLHYMALILDQGRGVRDDVSRPAVLGVRRIRDRVTHEINKFQGFVRFERTAEGLYYAPIRPDSNIVGFLGPHFVDRFADMAFIIHDVSRGIAFWHERGGIEGSGPRAWGIADLSRNLEGMPDAADEPLYKSMWREYFKVIAVRERRNPVLQAKNMPRRYWRFLTEMKTKTGF